jgi:hypothetical protein
MRDEDTARKPSSTSSSSSSSSAPVTPEPLEGRVVDGDAPRSGASSEQRRDV